VLLIFPLYFLRSFAYAGIGVVLIAMAAAVVVLPALLAVLGQRVNSGRLPWARNREPSTAAPFWGRLAGQAMRRPALVAIPVLAVLMLVALPLRHVQFGTPDDRVMPTTTQSRAVGDVLRTARALPDPDGVRVYVGGQTAELIDSTQAIGSRLLPAGLLIVLTTFIVLFLFTGSVLQPIRSLVLNAVTLAATAGLMVWIFQEGHLSGPLHFTALPLDTSMLMLLFCVAFGLSMDYEVIVLGRIKELHDRGRDNRAAVTDGLTHSGRIGGQLPP